LTTQLQHASSIFSQQGLPPVGFRSPYLSRNENLYQEIDSAGFSYISNQPYLWEVLDPGRLSPDASSSYQRALAYYDPWLSSRRPSIPRLLGNLVEIPVSLPDDEILFDRLRCTPSQVAQIWSDCLLQSHQRGELFTLQLHPERIPLCAESLVKIIDAARSLSPKVWCASLSDIAAWWKTLSSTTLEITEISPNQYHCALNSHRAISVLARAVGIDALTSPFTNGFQRIHFKNFTFTSSQFPVIGISPRNSSKLTNFLKHQGFITHTSQERGHFSYYFDRVEFDPCQENRILEQLNQPDVPLIRLGRWPNGTQSALAITGDIDAMTLWDYGLRLIGR
jgi:hypothetical protein